MVLNSDDAFTDGGNKPFPPTPWTLIVDTNLQSSIKNELFSQYWPPLYCYLRRKGHDNEQAKDLAQGFFLDVILGRQLFHKADRSRGKFRTLLLTAIDRYAIDQYRSQQRCQPVQHIPIHDVQIPDAAPDDPQRAFVYTWTAKLLDQTITELQTECCKDGMSVHWELFNLKFLGPIMENTETPSLTNLCQHFGIDDMKTASNMIISVKRRFRQLLKCHIRKLVDSDAEVGDEIDDIIRILAK
jgi:RNA polymerase sigma-70 factor (ECF subfamily)